MKVGLFVTGQQHLDTDMVLAFEEQVSMVRHARDQGWDSLFSGQHFLNEGDNKAFQLVPFLARLMAEAGDMTTGLGVLLLNLHNPVLIAETVATLDILARGNFVFGVGLGYRDVEFDAFNVPRGRRVARFEEYLALVKRLWTEDSVSHEGDTCILNDVTMNVRPVQQPHPPVWIAANNDGAIRRAARLGDAWFVNPHATFATLSDQMQVYRDELDRCEKPFPEELPVLREIYCAADRATALELAGPHLFAKYEAYAAWGQDKVMPAAESFDRPREELVNDRFILGSPDDCFEQLRPYREQLGANHLVLRTHWAGMPLSDALASMQLISDELLPALKTVSPERGLDRRVETAGR